eukprot:scaffold1883_cov396-Prasinococcus_capsulatus_cf.AAC.26
MRTRQAPFKVDPTIIQRICEYSGGGPGPPGAASPAGGGRGDAHSMHMTSTAGYFMSILWTFPSRPAAAPPRAGRRKASERAMAERARGQNAPHGAGGSQEDEAAAAAAAACGRAGGCVGGCTDGRPLDVALQAPRPAALRREVSKAAGARSRLRPLQCQTMYKCGRPALSVVHNHPPASAW